MKKHTLIFSLIFCLTTAVISQAGELFEEHFTREQSDWQLDNGARIVNNCLELTATGAQGTSSWIPVDKSAYYEVEYTICCPAGEAQYIVMPLLDIRERSLVDDTKILDCPVEAEKRLLRFHTTPIQEKTRLRIVSCGGSRIELKDICLRKISTPLPPAFEIVLDMQYSSGHGVFEPSQDSEITGILKINADEITVCVITEKTADGLEVSREELAVMGDEIKFAVPVPKPGTENLLEVCALASDGTEISRATQAIAHHRHHPGQVTFRDDGVTLIDGKPFFMLAHWWFTRRGDKGGNVDWWYENDLDAADDMVFLKEAGFNTILVRTPNQVKLAGERGLKAIIEYPHKLPSREPDKTRAIEAYRQENETLRNDPGLLAYYGPDEPLVFVFPFDKIMESSAMVHKLDPYHPIFYNESPTGTAEVQHEYSLWCDTIGRDIYPVPGTPETRHGDLPEELKLAAVGAHTDICRESVYGRKPVWMILQGFGWLHIYGGRNLKKVEEVKDCEIIYPTYEESRFMAYNAITHGATGLMYHYLGYTVHVPQYFWHGLRNVLQELNFMSDILVARTVAEPALEVADPQVRMLVKNHDGKNCYIIVNESDKAVKAAIENCPETELYAMFQKSRIIPQNGSFTLKLQPYDVRIMRDTPFPDAADILHPEGETIYEDFPVLRGRQP